MKREDVVRKAAALLRLAARGGTVGESAAAASAAQAMLDRHNLTAGAIADAESNAAEQAEAEAEAAEQLVDFSEIPEGELDKHARTQSTPWRLALGAGLCRLHGCFAWRSRRASGFVQEIAGRPSSVLTVRYLYGWLAGEITRLVRVHGKGMGVRWRASFCVGAAREVLEMLGEQRRATVEQVRNEYANNPLAMVRINGAIARQSNAATEAWLTAERYRLHGTRFTNIVGKRTDSSALGHGRDMARRHIDVAPARGGSLAGRSVPMLKGR